MKNILWEILVPACDNNGKRFSLNHHKIWDKKVMQVSHGMTIQKIANGRWVSPKCGMFKEKMIPVRFISNQKEAKEIVNFTLSHYNQKAVLAYQLSNNMILVEKE